MVTAVCCLSATEITQAWHAAGLIKQLWELVLELETHIAQLKAAA